MKKIFFLALLYIVIINCSKSDDFMGSTPNGYKTFENPLIGYEMSIPSDITISTRSYPIEGNQENLIVNFSEPKDPYSANQEIMIFSSEISKRSFDFSSKPNTELIDHVKLQLDSPEGEIINSKYIFKNNKKIGLFQHIYTQLDPIKQTESSIFSYDIFDIMFVFDPNERKSFYVKCTVTKTDINKIKWNYENAIETCNKVMKTVKPI